MLYFIVGGIYTVIRTKVPVTCAEYFERYCLIGPWNSKTSPLEIEEHEPEDVDIRECLHDIRRNGIKIIYGTWLIDGSPNVLLFDLESAWHRLSEWRLDMWEQCQIPCPVDDREMNDSIVLGQLISWFMQLVRFDNLF